MIWKFCDFFQMENSLWMWWILGENGLKSLKIPMLWRLETFELTSIHVALKIQHRTIFTFTSDYINHPKALTKQILALSEDFFYDPFAVSQAMATESVSQWFLYCLLFFHQPTQHLHLPPLILNAYKEQAAHSSKQPSSNQFESTSDLSKAYLSNRLTAIWGDWKESHIVIKYCITCGCYNFPSYSCVHFCFQLNQSFLFKYISAIVWCIGNVFFCLVWYIYPCLVLLYFLSFAWTTLLSFI